jgi:hypothetical protein
MILYSELQHSNSVEIYTTELCYVHVLGIKE